MPNTLLNNLPPDASAEAVYTRKKMTITIEEMLSSIEAERVRNRLTKEDLAKELGVSTKTYYNWINEETDVPSSALLKMSKVFDVGIDYLLAGAVGVKNG